MVIVLCKLDEWKVDGDLPKHLIPISLSDTSTHDDHVILMIAFADDDCAIPETSKWNLEFILVMEKVFNVTLKGDGVKHNGIVGDYLGFGWSAKYKREDQVSYARLVARKQSIKEDVESCQEILMDDLHYASHSLNDIIPGITKAGSLITQSLADM